MDDLTVRIERHPDLDVEVCQAATVVLAERIKQLIGSTVDRAARGAGHAAPQRGQVQAGLRPAHAVSGRPRREGGRLRAMSENGTLRRGRPGYDQQGILDVAVAAFNQYGYDATSMGVLADRLGLSKSAIYHHFASKDEILERALDAALGALEGVLSEADAATGRAADRLDLVLRGAVHVLVDKLPVRDPAAARARQHRDRAARARPPPRVRQGRHRARRPRRRPRGRCAATSTRASWRASLFGMINSIVEWYRPGGREDADRLADDVIAVVLDGLRMPTSNRVQQLLG